MRTEVAESQQSYRRTLRYAEAIAGGEAQLAARLHVSVATMSSWSAGGQDIPDAVFLSAVDIICEASEDEIRRARNYRPPLSSASRNSLSGNR
jgi:hypothetical protein